MDQRTAIYRSSVFLYYLAFTAFIIGILVSSGNIWDESEHCHVAWLIGKEGLTPIKDFFQHHQPVLWDVLKIYFILGGNGPEVMYYGRIIVAFCLAIALISLRFYSVRIKNENMCNENIIYPGIFSIILFMMSNILLPTSFVIRPETLSAAFAVSSVFVWVQNKDSWSTVNNSIRDVIAGMLFGLAVYSSPRFLLFSGTYILLLNDNMRFNALILRRLFLLLCGIVISVASYILLSKIPFDYVIFNFKFSAYMQNVGSGASELKEITNFLYFVIVSTVVIYLLLSRSYRTKYLLMISYLFIVAVVTVISWGKYPYQQNCYAPACIVAVFWTWAEQNINWNHHKCKLMLLSFTLIISIFICYTIRSANTLSLYDVVSSKHKILDIMNIGDNVLVTTRNHPICVSDASYYAFPFAESHNRTCDAINNFKTDIKLPVCDYETEFINNQPTIIDRGFIDNYILDGKYPDKVINILKTKYYRLSRDIYIKKQGLIND